MNQKQFFGAEIKRLRNEKKLTQKKLCSGICSQPMLSAIESGKYIPNSKLLIQLCQRLEVSTEILVLKDNYEISGNISFSIQAETFCNQHEYEKLNEFMLREEVMNSIVTKEHFQAYYYYLGCSSFHVEKNLRECERNLKLSLAEGGKRDIPDSLSRLALASLALVNAKLFRKTVTIDLIKQSVVAMADGPYGQNLNIIYYLNALAYYELEDFEAAVTMIEEGVSFVTANDSHFMLANLFYLLAQISEKTEILSINQNAYTKSSIFEELYKEEVYKKI